MQLIFGRFEKKLLIKNTFSKQIWLLQNASTGEKYVGKFQPKGRLDKSNTKNVLHQASFLQQVQGHSGVPLMYWSGVENSEILVISQYLGFTLKQRLQQCGSKFSLKTTCMLGIQILNIIRNLHQKCLLNRNLNLTSLQFGRGLKSLTLYMNDMIDCKRFRNKKSYLHIPAKKGIKFSYTNSFGSARFHRNQEISRIDDIQSVVKILICCITGAKPNQKGEFEKTITIPTFLQEMIQKCHATEFAEDPNYEWFSQKLLSILFHNSWENDEVYDWMISPHRNKTLKISKYITSLKLEEDKQILAQFYDPYQQSVDIDEVTTKHYQFYGEKDIKVSQQLSEENQKALQLEKRLKKRKTIVKEKPDCVIF